MDCFRGETGGGQAARRQETPESPSGRFGQRLTRDVTHNHNRHIIILRRHKCPVHILLSPPPFLC